MTFTLTIETGNAAFGDTEAEAAQELGRIMHKLACDFTAGRDGPSIRHNGRPLDLNGNQAGRWTYSD